MDARGTHPPVTTRALYLQVAPDPTFCVLHEPSGPRADAAVLFCPPFGWEDMASYRARREWADRLAAGGVPVLRFDLPGSGDSAGTPGDPERVEAWLAAIAAGASLLATLPGCSRVIAVGWGMGGLLATRAAADGAPIDELVLWGARASGRAMVRELRAFSRMEGTLDELPDGGLPVAGYVLSEETVAALGAMDLSSLTFPDQPPARALLLERDGMPVDEGLRGGLAAAGVAVTSAPGPGYGDVLLDWQHRGVPEEVSERVRAWIAEGTGGAPRPRRGPAPGELNQLEPVPGVRETPLVVGGLFGVLAEPADGPARAPCVVLLNAGLQRRTGPNRMWTEMARRWAQRGIASVRIDIAGLGDSEGDPERYSATVGLYGDELIEEVGELLHGLEAQGLGDRFVLGGLCAGAYWSFQSAVRDDRVAGALLLNPTVLVWDQYLAVARGVRTMRRKVLRGRSWLRLMSGQSDYRLHLRNLRGLANRRMRPPAAAPPGQTDGQPDPVSAATVEPLLDRLGAKPVLFLFAGREALLDELESQGILGRLDRWPGVAIQHLPAEGETHTIRPVWLQRQVHRAVDEGLERVLEGYSAAA